MANRYRVCKFRDSVATDTGAVLLVDDWQVSGRNHTSFEERAAFDRYYVYNWSVWLDIYILLSTVWVVLSRDGAY